jgi:hypothetical protein
MFLGRVAAYSSVLKHNNAKRVHGEKYSRKKFKKKCTKYMYLHGHDNFLHNFGYIRPHFFFSLPRTPYEVIVIYSKLPNEEESFTEVVSAPCLY